MECTNRFRSFGNVCNVFSMWKKVHGLTRTLIREKCSWMPNVLHKHLCVV